MGKKRKSKKAIKMWKSIFKMVGIGMASIVGFLGASIGVYALFGGFNEKVVSLQGMNFEKSAYVLVGTGNDKEGNVIDSSIKLLPTNEDATKLNITLSSNDSNSVTYQTDDEGRNVGKVGSPLNIILTQERSGNIPYNKGGEFVLTAIQEEDLVYATTNVFVESKVQSLQISSNLNNSKLYPGSRFKVEATSFFPSNSLFKPKNQIFYDVFGQDYFTKQILYFSSNESIATVDNNGNVEVLSTGEFKISAYIASTYENNSKIMPRESYESDEKYFEELSELAVMNTYSFKSNSIEVTGITATANSFDVYVNESYKYSVDGLYESTDKQMNLDLNLIPPTNSNYTSKELAYKLEDVEIFEGYKDAEGKFYIAGKQFFNENLIQSTYFDVEKSKKPLCFKITPRDYTSLKDLYLIVRIANDASKVLTGEDLTEDFDISIDENAHYTFIKVNTKIVENTVLSLKTNKVLATYKSDGQENDEYILIYNGKKLNLEDLVDQILPLNSTYKDVRFFVKDVENCVLVLKGETNEVEIFEDEETGEKYIKTTGSGTVQVYASIFNKYRDYDSELVLENNSEENSEENNENVKTNNYRDELIRSNDFTIVVSSEVNLTNFILEEKAIEDITINKGQTINLSFDVTNTAGFKKAYNEGFFELITTSNIISYNVDLPGEDEKTVNISITAVEVGETEVSLKFNNSLLVLNNENKIEFFKIKIETNSVKSVSLLPGSKNYLDENNVLNFVVTNNTGKFDLYKNGVVVEDQQGKTGITLQYKIEGGNDETILNLRTFNYNEDDNIIEINSELLNEENKQLTITVNKLTENISFYVYVVENGQEIRSETVYINVSMIDSFNITAKRNENNTTYINSIPYENVIANTQFNLLDANNSNSYFIITGLNPNVFSISSENNLYDIKNNMFKSVTENTKCKVTINANFFGENDLLEERIYYFNIVPQFYIKNYPLNVASGSIIERNTLISLFDLYERSYSISNTNDNYKGNIIDEKQEGVKLNDRIIIKETTSPYNVISDSYTVPNNTFTNTSIKLIVSLTIDEISYNGLISLNVTSNLDIENATNDDSSLKYINNGETIELVNLFEVTGADDWKITNVELSNETKNILELNNISLSTDKKSLIIPRDINLYNLDNLVADITATIDGQPNIKKVRHNFSLNFKLTNLEINESNMFVSQDKKIIYLTENDLLNESNLVNDFVLLANEAIQDGEIKNIKNSVACEYDIEKKTLTFKINSIIKTYDYVLIENYATQNSSFNGVLGKAYCITELIAMNTNLPSETEYNVIIDSVLDNENNIVDLSDITIENNKYIIFKNAGTYNIVFNFLGRNITVDGYIIEDTKITLEGFTNIYSNLSYDLFNAENLNNLSGLNYNVKLYESNGTTQLIDENISLQRDGSNTKLIVGNYAGEAKDFFIKVEIYSTNHTPAVISYRVKLNSLILTTKYDELIGNKQVLINKFKYNDIGEYYSIATTNNDIHYQYKLYDANDNEISGFSLTNYILNIDTSINTRDLYLVYYVVEENEGLTINKKLLTLDFYVKNYNLIISSSEIKDFYEGQTITSQDLLKYITIKDENNTVINKNNLLVFSSNNIRLSNTTVSVTVSLGENQEILSIIPTKIIWSDNKTFEVYPDVKVTNYVSAKVNNNDLPLSYEASNISVENQTSVETEDIVTIKNNNLIIATLNKKTGEINISNDLEVNSYSFAIKVFVTNATDQSQILKFNVAPLSKVNLTNPLNIYIGENETVLKNKSYFLSGSETKSVDFEIDSLVILNGENSSIYSYYYNSLNDSYDILKNGKKAASICKNAKTGTINRDVFVCTSDLDACEITLKGYFNLNETDNYCIESLRNNYVELTLKCIGINVVVNSSAMAVDTNDYYILTVDSEGKYVIDSSLTTTAGDNLSFDKLYLQSAFIGDVTENNEVLTFNSKIIDLNLGYSTTKINTPNGTEINFDKESGSFSSVKQLVDYVFITLNYEIGSYRGELKVVLKPKDLNIVFNCKELENNNYFLNVFAPSVYSLGYSNLFKINNTIINGVNIFNDNTISFKENFVLNNTEGFNTTIGLSSSNFELKYKLNSQQPTITISINSNTFSFADYTIKFDYNENSYFYFIRVRPINVSVKNLPDLEEALEIENAETNSYNKALLIDSEMDLKKYIYIDNKSILHNDNEEYLHSLTFNYVDNDYYNLTTAGIFTVKNHQEIINIEPIYFSLYGKSYNLYLKGSDLAIEFDNLYSLQAGASYFIAGCEEKNATTLELERITVYQKTTNEFTNIINSEKFSIDVKIKNYYFGGQNISEESLFNITINNDVKKFYYAGQFLFSLTTLDNNVYKLTTSNNLDGELTIFYIACYSNYKIISNDISVSNQTIIVNYIEPVIYNDKQYQNVLSNATFDLSTLVSGINKDASYSLVEASSIASISGSNLVTENVYSITNENYLKVKVKYNNLTNYINIKVVPNEKISTLMTNFNVLQNEDIVLYDFFKLYEFDGYDANNLPTYKMISEYKDGDNYITSLKVIEYKNISIKGYNLAFTPIVLENLSATTYIGETIDLSNLVKNNSNYKELSLQNNSIVFSDDNNFVDSYGNFVANKDGLFDVNVSVNDVLTNMQVLVNPLKIQVNYNNYIILTNEETNETKKYEMFYETQSIPTNLFISTDLKFTEQLNYEINIEKYGNLILDNFSIIDDNESIKLVYLNNLIFEINNEKIICYENLSDEILLNIIISLNGNNFVENIFNLRLMPVIFKLAYNNIVSISTQHLDQNGYFNLVENIASAFTNCDENNISLNDKINFYELLEGGAHKLIENQKLDLSSNVSLTKNLIVKLGEDDNQIISSIINLIYTYNDKENVNVSTYSIVIAVRSDTTNITYNEVTRGSQKYFDVYNSNNELLVSIDSNGNYSNESLVNSFDIKIQKIDNKKVYSERYTKTSTVSNIVLGNDERYTEENGVKFLNVLAGEKYCINNILGVNSCVESSDSFMNLDITSTGLNYFITANVVNEITYGYFTVKNSSNITKKVFVKIYPFSVSENYIADYESDKNVIFDDKTYIKTGDKFYTIYIDNLTKKIDLDNYVNVFSDLNDINLSYQELFKIEDNSLINGSITDLSSNMITINKPTELMVFEVLVYINNIDTNLKLSFRCLPVSINNIDYNIYNNSKIELINLLGLMNNNDLFNKLSFSLSNVDGSYIENNYLYINEKYAKSVYLNYSFEDIVGKINLKIFDEARNIDDYVINNIVYRQRFYNDTNLNIESVVGVVSARLNNIFYEDIETVFDSNNNIEYFEIKKLLKIAVDGIISFYDANSNGYISQNKLGIIYLQIEKQISVGELNYIVYEYYKLNNYNIEYNSSTEAFSYIENGNLIIDILKYSLVNEKGEIILNSTINDIEICSNNITVNIFTGEGNYSVVNDSNIYLKVYISYDNYNYGNIYKLFAISKT